MSTPANMNVPQEAYLVELLKNSNAAAVYDILNGVNVRPTFENEELLRLWDVLHEVRKQWSCPKLI
jgi:hypothetical protein